MLVRVKQAAGSAELCGWRGGRVECARAKSEARARATARGPRATRRRRRRGSCCAVERISPAASAASSGWRGEGASHGGAGDDERISDSSRRIRFAPVHAARVLCKGDGAAGTRWRGEGGERRIGGLVPELGRRSCNASLVLAASHTPADRVRAPQLDRQPPRPPPPCPPSPSRHSWRAQREQSPRAQAGSTRPRSATTGPRLRQSWPSVYSVRSSSTLAQARPGRDEPWGAHLVSSSAGEATDSRPARWRRALARQGCACRASVRWRSAGGWTQQRRGGRSRRLSAPRSIVVAGR